MLKFRRHSHISRGSSLEVAEASAEVAAPKVAAAIPAAAVPAATVTAVPVSAAGVGAAAVPAAAVATAVLPGVQAVLVAVTVALLETLCPASRPSW